VTARRTTIVDVLKGLVVKTAITQLLKDHNMLSFLDGYKTYVIGVVTVVVGALAMIGWSVPGLPPLDPQTGWPLILNGLALLGLRRGIKTGA